MIVTAQTILIGCTFGGGPTPYVPASHVPKEPVTLKSVNKNWTGSRAQIRYPFKVRKGTDDEGWSKSKWAKFPQEDTEVRLFVSDRDALKPILPEKRILVGASLICDGWSLRRPEKGKDLQVDFHFENYPSKARIIFENKDLEDLPEAESFLRLKILKLYPKSEQLRAVPSQGSPGRKPSPPSKPAPAPHAYKPKVEVLTASVQPARVRAGEQVDLVIHYRVSGIPEGTIFEAVEHRTLLSGDKKLTFFKDPINRTQGSFTSTKKIRVPAGTEPGVYRFLARVVFAGSESKTEAIFEVN